jgi:hypothetical protein
MIQAGEILAVRQGLYWHVGICDGRGNVLSRRPAEGVVRETLDEFAQGGELHIVPIDRPSFPPAEIVTRAGARLGEAGYDWVERNCEHFVGECVYGHAASRQIKLAGLLAASVAIAAKYAGPNWALSGAVALTGLGLFAWLAKPPTARALEALETDPPVRA